VQTAEVLPLFKLGRTLLRKAKNLAFQRFEKATDIHG
jgi:hypothetical protein